MIRSHMMMLLILCFLMGFRTNHVMGDENLIISTCGQTPFKDVCIGALKSDPSSARADTAGLGVIIVKQLEAKTKSAIGVVNQRQKTEKDPKVVSALNRCAEVYNAVIVGDVPMAIQAFTFGNPKFAEQGANDAAGEAGTCERAFPGGSSPVSGLNKEISQLAKVAAAIARLLL